MAVNLRNTGKKLVGALNSRGRRITFNTKQFWGVEGKPINQYSVAEAFWDDTKHKYISKELYNSTSMVRIILFLRDLWYLENGWELPTDQVRWNTLRKEINYGQYGQQ